MALIESIRGQVRDLHSNLFVVVVGIWGTLITLAASASWFLVGNFAPLPIKSMVALSITGAGFGLSVPLLFGARRIAQGAIAMGLGTFAFFGVMYCLYLPRADFLRVSPRVADILIANHVTHAGQVQMLKYMEPSLAFAQGGTIREAGDLWFSKACEAKLTPWLVLPKSVWDEAPADLRADYEIVGSPVFGLAYADRGKWLTVLVIHRRGVSDKKS